MTTVKMPEPDIFDYPNPMKPAYVRMHYTEAQLKQYGDDRAREALEMAAETCDSTMYVEGDGTVSKYGPMTNANVEIKKCADAIRLLAKEIK
jgi:hypothetical protein